MNEFCKWFFTLFCWGNTQLPAELPPPPKHLLEGAIVSLDEEGKSVSFQCVKGQRILCKRQPRFGEKEDPNAQERILFPARIDYSDVRCTLVLVKSEGRAKGNPYLSISQSLRSDDIYLRSTIKIPDLKSMKPAIKPQKQLMFFLSLQRMNTPEDTVVGSRVDPLATNLSENLETTGLIQNNIYYRSKR